MKTLSQFFPPQTISLSTGDERVVRGGRGLFPQVREALEASGVRRVVVIGWGSQAPAHAQNLRETFAETGAGITVAVALRDGSASRAAAIVAGFTEEAGTLGTIEALVPEADLVLFLVSDQAQTENWGQVTAAMKPGATLGFSHGFLPLWMSRQELLFRDDINVVLVAPKGVGASVRQLYLQGVNVDGAGINSSFAVHQDPTGKAADVALAWAVGIGSPAVFQTTMRNEVVSDLVGERAGLLGGHWALAEALYEYFLVKRRRQKRANPKLWAFLRSAKALSRTVPQDIGRRGLLGLYANLMPFEQSCFRAGFACAYRPSLGIIGQIYENVTAGDEVASVIERTARLGEEPFSSVEAEPMWVSAREEGFHDEEASIDADMAFAAGAYIGMLFAGMSYLVERGHPASEAVNEQLIEAIDSLDPIADKRGVGAMVDFCSTTARIGARRWAPEFKRAFAAAIQGEDWGTGRAEADFEDFVHSPIHGDIERLFGFRPKVQLEIGETDRSSGQS